VDSGIAAAARALEEGDVLRALDHVARRNDAHALAMRGVVMAQLGELETARKLLLRAKRSFAKDINQASRCAIALAEIEIAERRLTRIDLRRAASILERRGDEQNASWARIVSARRSIMVGDVDAAERLLQQVHGRSAVLLAVAALAEHEIALRRLDAERAKQALIRAKRQAAQTRATSLEAEIDESMHLFERPVARINIRFSGNQGLSLAVLPVK